MQYINMITKLLPALWLAMGLTACAETIDLPAPPVLKHQAKVIGKVGRPYQVAGLWYTPSDDRGYDQTGIGSWYGPDFNGKPTANGEIYDMNGISAAHKTLPMPSYVEVTNLDNGRQLVVRVNDRGPYKTGRIIDLSKRAAQLLGYDNSGTAHVRVRRVFPDNVPSVQIADNGFGMNDDGPAGAIPPAVPAQQISSIPLPPAGADVKAIAMGDDAPALDGFFVQVAAVGDETRAGVLAADIRRFGATVIEPLPGSAGQLYRVRIGPYLSRDAAVIVQKQVKAAGYEDAKVLLPGPARVG